MCYMRDRLHDRVRLQHTHTNMHKIMYTLAVCASCVTTEQADGINIIHIRMHYGRTQPSTW